MRITYKIGFHRSVFQAIDMDELEAVGIHLVHVTCSRAKWRSSNIGVERLLNRIAKIESSWTILILRPESIKKWDDDSKLAFR